MMKRAKRIIASVTGVIICMAMAGCGGSRAPEAISLAREGYILCKSGETYSIAADVEISGDGAAREVTYSISDASVAEVSPEGVLTAKGEGAATVTVSSAEDESVSASAAVLVYDYSGVYTCEKYIDAMGCDVKISIDISDGGTFRFYRYPMNVNLEGGGRMEGLADGGTYTVSGNEIDFAAEYLGSFTLSFMLDKNGNAQLSGDTPTGGASTSMTFEKTSDADMGEAGTYSGNGETESGAALSYRLEFDAGAYVLTVSMEDGSESTVSTGSYSFLGTEIEFFAAEGITFSAAYDESRQVIEGMSIPVSADNSYESTAATLARVQ